MIYFDQIKKQFTSRVIFENFSLNVADGEFVSIIGPSGCGKSTLLKLAASLDKEYEGAICRDTETIGMLFQEPRLFPWMSVWENISIVSKKAYRSDIEELLDMVGLAAAKSLYPKALSGGMARRAALVRAFINRPALILLDEPFVSLDKPTAKALQADFMRLTARFNPSVLMVTHDLTEGLEMSDTVVFMGKDPANVIYTHHCSGDVDAQEAEILKKYPDILKGVI